MQAELGEHLTEMSQMSSPVVVVNKYVVEEDQDEAAEDRFEQ